MQQIADLKAWAPTGDLQNAKTFKLRKNNHDAVCTYALCAQMIPFSYARKEQHRTAGHRAAPRCTALHCAALRCAALRSCVR